MPSPFRSWEVVNVNVLLGGGVVGDLKASERNRRRARIGDLHVLAARVTSSVDNFTNVRLHSEFLSFEFSAEPQLERGSHSALRLRPRDIAAGGRETRRARVTKPRPARS